MPIRVSKGSMKKNVDVTISSIDNSKKMAETILKDKNSVKDTQISKLHTISTEVTYFEQVVSNKNGFLSNVSSLNKFDPNLIKFKKIKNFTILTQELEAEYSDEIDQGLSESGAAIILPNTIIPNPNDHFVMKVYDKWALFRVDSVKPYLIEGNSGFEIEYSLRKSSINPYDFEMDNQVDDEYSFDYVQYGTGFRTVYKDKEAETIRKCREVMKVMVDSYNDCFYYTNLDSIFCSLDKLKHEDFLNIFDDNNMLHVGCESKHDITQLYDPFLVKFVNDNSINNPSDKVIYVENYLPDVFYDYKYSIFGAIERGTLSRYKLVNQRASKVMSMDISSSSKLYGRYIITHSGDECLNSGIVNLFPNNFINTINNFNKNTTVNNTIPDILNSIVAIYLNLSEGDYLHRMGQVIDMLYNECEYVVPMELDQESDAFYIFPLVVYVLKYHIRYIMEREV